MDLGNQGTEENTVDVYNIELTETLELEEDEAAGCTDYKKTKYKNYGNCVLSQIEKTFLPILGCVPPWFYKGSYNNNRICERTLRDFDDRLKDAMEVMDMTSFQVAKTFAELPLTMQENMFFFSLKQSIWFDFYRTQVYLGSNLWVPMSVCLSVCL